ncbi:MAG TPA: hypothetical protein VGJ84_05400, partial [Polyangiaceae bacterium]
NTFGLGFSAGTPPGKFGGFGELGFAFVYKFNAIQQVSGGNCGTQTAWQNSLDYSGAGVRLGGGANIPLARFLQITPVLSYTLSQFSHFSAKTGCETGVSATDNRYNLFTVIPASQGTVDTDINKPTTHGVLFLGVGVDVWYGL